MSDKKSVFETLSSIDCTGHIEEKNKLSYLSWAWAYIETKKKYPHLQTKVYENEQGWNYFTDGKTGWVKVSTTIEDDEIIEYLPIMNYNNKSIPLNNITSMDVNKAIQRGLTKSLARQGLAMHVYAGEDFPGKEGTKDADTMDNRENAPQNNYPTPSKQTPADKKRMYAEFVNYVTNYGIDYKEFEEWMKDFGVKLGEEIHKWLRNKENLNTQLDSYKTFLSEQSA